MPYISAKDDRRLKLRNGEPALSAGELNYQIFYYVKYENNPLEIVEKTIKECVDNFLGAKPNYQRWNDMTGALIRCSKEIKRRIGKRNVEDLLIEIMESYDDRIADYEDIKIKENGDVE